MIILDRNGKTELVQVGPGTDKPDVLKAMQEAVGGYIQRVPLQGHDKIALYVNEDGIQQRLPLNVNATHIADRVIVGNAIIVEEYRHNGTTRCR